MNVFRVTRSLLLALVILPGFQFLELRADDSGATPARARESTLKAAFLTEFTRYVTWPTNRFAGPDSPVIIAILGRDPFGQELDELAARKNGGRPIEIRRVATPTEASECHVVFIGRREKEHEEEWLTSLSRVPVLTVGESGRTISHGGILEFVVINGFVRFEANWAAMQTSGIRLRAQLLDLARKVHNPPERGS
jgi:hypothetical protein